MTSLIAAGGSGRSASVIPAVPAASSVTTIAFIRLSPLYPTSPTRRVRFTSICGTRPDRHPRFMWCDCSPGAHQPRTCHRPELPRMTAELTTILTTNTLNRQERARSRLSDRLTAAIAVATGALTDNPRQPDTDYRELAR